MQPITNQPHQLRDYFIGEIVGYQERAMERERELLSLRRWHVVHAMSGRESDVAQEIERNGMAAYLPRIERKVRVNACRHRATKRPMYPGYLFCGFDPAGELWHSIAGIEGVIRLFMLCFRPVAVPWQAIVRIQEIERIGEVDHNCRPPMAVQAGDAIRLVDSGGLTGLFSTVMEVDQEGRRIRIVLEMLHRSWPMWLAEDKFEVL